jgi:hypothetical protein
MALGLVVRYRLCADADGSTDNEQNGVRHNVGIGGFSMSDRDLLLVITICRILGKDVGPAAVLAQYEFAKQLLLQKENGG